MVYSYTTHSKQGNYYYIKFEDVMDGTQLLIKFLPKSSMVFSRDNLNLQQMRFRDPEVLLQLFEEYGLTLILKGI